MAIAVLPGEARRTDLGIDDQHRTRRAGKDVLAGEVEGEGRRRAGDVHVEGRALRDAERVLHLDGDRREGALHRRGGTITEVDVGRRPAGVGQRLARRGNGHLGLQRQCFVGASGQARAHAPADRARRFSRPPRRWRMRGLFDRFDARRLERRDFSAGDAFGIVGVEATGVFVVRGDSSSLLIRSGAA